MTCHTCRSPDTILQKDTRLFFLQCEACGSRCSVASIKSGFQVNCGNTSGRWCFKLLCFTGRYIKTCSNTSENSISLGYLCIKSIIFITVLQQIELNTSLISGWFLVMFLCKIFQLYSYCQ